jgi:hypothetical protein
MAFVTGTSGREVVGVFAGGQGAVVAGAALTRGNICMVEPGPAPYAGAVALVALAGGDRVSSRFAGDLKAVVTGGATADHRGVIDAVYRFPSVRVMAVFAHIRCCDVTGGFDRITGDLLLHMAAHTLSRGSAKYARAVTALALGRSMPAGERKARDGVIEVVTRNG